MGPQDNGKQEESVLFLPHSPSVILLNKVIIFNFPLRYLNNKKSGTSGPDPDEDKAAPSVIRKVIHYQNTLQNGALHRTRAETVTSQ